MPKNDILRDKIVLEHALGCFGGEGGGLSALEWAAASPCAKPSLWYDTIRKPMKY